MKRSHAQTFLVIPARKAVGLTSVALGLVRALQRLGVEALRTDDAGRCQKQTEQSCQQYSFRQSRHRTGIRGKGNLKNLNMQLFLRASR